MAPAILVEENSKQAYCDKGFLVVPDALSLQEVQVLRDEAVAICRGQRGAIDGWVGPHDGQTDDQVIAQYLCVHFPHKTSQLMLRTLRHRIIVDVLTTIIGPDVKCMQSMLFIKAAGKPGQAWHQDELYIPTRDRSLTGAWIAMDDATIANGCLWVIPGSHTPGVLWPQHSTENDDRFDCAQESIHYPYRDEDAIPVEVRAGSIVFFNGYLLHRSLPNTAPSGYRRALVNHYMSGQSLLPWGPPRKDEAMGTLDCRDIVMVAGHDPYWHKPIVNNNAAHVRPSGEGGCKPGKQDESAFRKS